MSQNDFTIANQGFPAFRADLNSALQALASNNSGDTEPSTTFANMWWYDSANNIMYIRNEDNDAWIKFAELDQANDKFVLSGTLQLDDGTVSAPALTFNSDTNMGIYRGGTDILKFVTAGTDAVTIDASQNLLVGTNDTFVADNTSGNGLSYRAAAGDLSVAASNTPAIYGNRMGSDGDIAVFRKDGSTVGSIGTISGTGVSLISTTGVVQVGSSDAGFVFNGGGNYILPWNVGANTSNDGGVALGASSHRFLNIYLSGGVVLDDNPTAVGGDVTSKTLDDYEEGTWTPNVGGNATYTTQLGRYTKIGNHVLAQFDMTISVLGTGSVAAISGFPFTNVNVAVASGSISFFSGVSSNVYYLSFYVINNSTDAFMTGITSAGGTISNTLATFQNGARVNGMVSYRST